MNVRHGYMRFRNTWKQEYKHFILLYNHVLKYKPMSKNLMLFLQQLGKGVGTSNTLPPGNGHPENRVSIYAQNKKSSSLSTYLCYDFLPVLADQTKMYKLTFFDCPQMTCMIGLILGSFLLGFIMDQGVGSGVKGQAQRARPNRPVKPLTPLTSPLIHFKPKQKTLN